jgi:FAD/FMN-containing dehydrogenase
MQRTTQERTTVHTITPLADRLREQQTGRVITPDDTDYDTARAVVAGGYDLRPSAIVRVKNARDVATVVTVASDAGVELAIRSGGHSGAAYGSTDGGIVIDLREMKGLEIDPGSRTAWAETGLTAGEVTVAAAEHGLAVGFGDTASVGIGGITTGGGIGYLVRKHGLTIDSVLAAEVVTADGEILTVDEAHHPDLFWAIRGGGGNLGVVTRFHYRLHPVDGVVGGILVLPATSETVEGFIAAAEGAPEELSAIANVMGCPPMPFVPEEHHGSLVILAMICHVGDIDAGERAMAPFRALAEPLADLVRPITYPEMYPPEDEPAGPMVAAARTFFLDRVDRPAAETIISFLEASDSPMKAAQLRVLGGAMARVPADATAFAHRSSRIMGIVVNLVTSPEERERRETWARDFAVALHQGDDGAYVNFLEDDDPEVVRAAYPGGAYERLAAIKARHDPHNLFHRNQNVPPA